LRERHNVGVGDSEGTWGGIVFAGTAQEVASIAILAIRGTNCDFLEDLFVQRKCLRRGRVPKKKKRRVPIAPPKRAINTRQEFSGGGTGFTSIPDLVAEESLKEETERGGKGSGISSTPARR